MLIAACALGMSKPGKAGVAPIFNYQASVDTTRSSYSEPPDLPPPERTKASRDADNSMVSRMRKTYRTYESSVTVGGQVRSPGPIPYCEEMSLWGAIQAAGGPTEFGSIRRVKVIRDGHQRTYDVTKTQFMRFLLQKNDVVEVPQKMLLGN